MERCRSMAALALAVAALMAAAATTAAQESPQGGPDASSLTDVERLRPLVGAEARRTAEEKAARPPFEFYRSQVPPSDVLPWVKAWHWHGLILELRANLGDYDGKVQSAPLPLPGTSWDVTFGREARLVRELRTRLAFSALLPTTDLRELPLELRREGSLRGDQVYLASVKPLAPHQMLALVLTKGPNGGYVGWGRFDATVPSAVERGDVMAADLFRYYRLVLPLEPDRPLLPTHPLTWTAVSHVIWDGLEPDAISVSQQEALVDWLHWGGQLTLIGGAGPKFSPQRGGFLDPYLPADPVSDGRALDADDLEALSRAYRPPISARTDPGPSFEDLGVDPAFIYPGPIGRDGRRLRHGRYGEPDPIRPPSDRPVRSAGMRPRPGSTIVPIRPGGEPLAVERRVGRGRITMLAVDPTDPSLASWLGLDTLVRRVVFRRPEESAVELGTAASPGAQIPAMAGPDLSWYRIAARDVGAPGPPAVARVAVPMVPPVPGQAALPALRGVAEWRDGAAVPRICRDALEKSSGIKVPSSSFVLTVIVAYILAVAPLNWLVCRYALRRREAAWVAAPLLAIGFAGAVERSAAYDLGFNSAGDELDVLEIQGEHPRGHLSRFGSIYSRGHGKFAIRFPDDPTALALPLDTGRSIGGEDRAVASWTSFPVPSLEGFVVAPRSLALYRAEQMTTLAGPIALDEDDDRRSIRNDSGLELRDAVLLEFVGGELRRERALGTIADGASVALDDDDPAAVPEAVAGFDGPDPSALLAALRTAREEGRPEEADEIRLVAWTPGFRAGPRIEPPLDRTRGATVVLAHLRQGPPPDPAGPRYDARAAQPR